MVEKEDIVEPETVACAVCLKEVPKSVADSPEGTEYVYYFCGAECYEQWKSKKGEKNAESGKQT
ncbi:MAG: DUF3330 domain-containing protein [Pseudomonadota bacterium]|nr:MAG: DUF3330 domain-containing protein [Pseudomonadota bacterium]